MRLNTARTFAAIGASSVLSAAALAQHAGDVGLSIIGGAIVTGAYDGSTFTPGQRVFGAEFGELFPDFTDEPGFDSLPGTFAPGSSLSFTVHKALRLWEDDHFGSVIPAEPIAIGFGPLAPVLTPATDVLTPGFALAVGSNGEWHRHLEYSLQPPATSGIYLLELSLTSSDPSVQPSLPFWLVFNQNMPETEHQEAIDWANQHLVPGPGSGVGILAAGGLLAKQRRRDASSR